METLDVFDNNNIDTLDNLERVEGLDMLDSLESEEEYDLPKRISIIDNYGEDLTNREYY